MAEIVNVAALQKAIEEHDALAESHAELMAALDAIVGCAWNCLVRGLCSEHLDRAQAAHAQARALVAK